MTEFGLRSTWLFGLIVVLVTGGCPSDDSAESSGGTETSTGDTTAGDTATTETGDGCTPPPGEFGDCRAGTDACNTDGPKLCISDGQDPPGFGVCARRCTTLCDCWAAPADGDAPVACEVIDPSGDPACFLDCSAGQACPSGMVCTDTGMAQLCVFQ